MKGISSVAAGRTLATRIMDSLLYWLATDRLPLRTVEKEGFLDFMKTILPNYDVPSRRTVTRAMEIRQKEVEEKLKKQFASVTSHVITCDVWTDVTKQSYLGVTDHFLGSDLKLKMAALTVKPLHERHTGENIAEVLSQCLESYEIRLDEVTAIVTDGGTNMIKAVKLTVDLSRHIICAAHIMAHIVPSVLKDFESLARLIEKVREIIKLVRRSVILSDELKKLQLNSGCGEGKQLVLILDVETRWNSTYFMLKRFLELKTFVPGLLMKSSSKLEMPRREEIEILEKATKIFGFVKFFIRGISGERYATGAAIITLLDCVRNAFKGAEPNTRTGQQLKNALLKELENRFAKLEDNEVLAIASIFDPCFKKLHFQSSLKCAIALREIDGFMKAEARRQGCKSQEIEAPAKVSVTEGNIWDFHDQLSAKGVQSVRTNEMSFHPELHFYISSGTIDRTKDPIEYWINVREAWPILSKVALKFANVVASSVPCERLLSMAGNIKDEERNRLTGAI